MKFRTLAALFAALCLFTAGCGDDDDGGDDASSDGDSTTTAADADEDETPSTLALDFELNVAATPAGNSLVTSEGLTLYIYTEDPEDGSESVCTGGCAESWPPYAVSGTPTASDEVTGMVGTVERENGTLQATIEGRPLYTFSGDEGAGTANGQGASGVWYAVNAAGETIGT